MLFLSPIATDLGLLKPRVSTNSAAPSQSHRQFLPRSADPELDGPHLQDCWCGNRTAPPDCSRLSRIGVIKNASMVSKLGGECPRNDGNPSAGSKRCKPECGYRIDLLGERPIVVEPKSLEVIAPIQEVEGCNCLKLSSNTPGLLLNFHLRMLMDGVRRYIGKESKELTAGATEFHGGNGEDSQTHDA